MKATDAIIKKLHAQKLEITKLISMVLIASINSGYDKGVLNNMTQALKQNEEITKIIEQWDD
tara:strand:+ start:1090 stop:1275 length:186 start_codon:yes stop_codon:yes gene_type:complete